ncbi:MAG: VanW family protein [Dysosmobacter sp.]|uniref:VanW family protein n=1 Tax=Dysosmobacter sp. TaxID=2591382 RepID=UPI00283E154E|nr:VanW family protein [Dysosmobacter sp.]MDR3982702.1 VanW family protein [Dysosmobacter sp.]
MEQTTKEAIAQRNGGKRLSGGAGKKPLIIIGILVAVLAAAYLGLCAYAASLDVFFPNTTINGVDVAGMTVQQAGEELGSTLPQRTMAFYLPLTDKSGDGVTAPEGETLYDPEPAATVSCESLGITQDLDYTAYAQSVYDRSQGQSGFFQGGWSFLAHLFRSQGAKGVYLEPDETVFRQKLSELAQTFSRPAQDTSYEVGQDSLTVTRELDGLAVTEADLEQPIREALSSEADGAVYVDAAILPAQTLSAQDIHDAVAGSMKNAGYDAATDSITPEQAGAEFDVAEAQSLLDAASPGETVEIPADIQQPHVTAAELKDVLFRDVLGQCRTHVSGTSARINNVKLSAAACNGVVLNTGDVFSYNATTGQRTTAKGYQAAPAYVGGETVDEVGGGVCQTSSTIYYACLRANLEITERYAHRYVPAYIDWGMDATVSWGGPDYKFTNNTDYPIKIVATYSGGYLTVKILGTNVDGTYVKMTNEVLSKTNWETVYKDDETLPAGTEKVTTTPYTGYKVKSYRNVYSADGKLISSTYEATSDYKVRNKVISRGPALPEQPETPVTGPAETPVETPTQTPEETTPSTTTPETSTLDPSQEQTQTPAQETPSEP